MISSLGHSIVDDINGIYVHMYIVPVNDDINGIVESDIINPPQDSDLHWLSASNGTFEATNLLHRSVP